MNTACPKQEYLARSRKTYFEQLDLKVVGSASVLFSELSFEEISFFVNRRGLHDVSMIRIKYAWVVELLDGINPRELREIDKADSIERQVLLEELARKIFGAS